MQAFKLVQAAVEHVTCGICSWQSSMRSACLQTDIHRANATTRSQYATCRPRNCCRARACPVTTAQTAKLPNTMPSESTLSVRFRSLIQPCDAVAHGQHHGTFAATCIPPTFESVSLGPRVKHLSAAKNSTLLQCIGQQLMLPEVGPLHERPY